MNHPRSASYDNNKYLIKKSLFPSFRQPKLPITMQEMSAMNKSQVFFNIKFIPFEIIVQRKRGETDKILIGAQDVLIISSNKKYQGSLGVSSNQDFAREWIFTHVKIKKVGDQNIFTNTQNMIRWDKLEETDKKILTTINIKQIIKNPHKKFQSFSTGNIGQRDERNKQMKAYIANVMQRKQGRKLTEKNQIQAKLHAKKNTTIFRNKIPFKEEEYQNEISMKYINHPITSLTILAGLDSFKDVRSARKQIIDTSKFKELKESKFTGKSQKQTTAGDQNSSICHKILSKTSQMNSIIQQSENKKRNKFDSQPYFYQTNHIASQLSNRKQNINRYPNMSRQQVPRSQQSKILELLPNKTLDLADCLKNQSECQSQQVQQDIKRMSALQQSITNGIFDNKTRLKQGEESSECFQSKQLGESSGTIYESKYE